MADASVPNPSADPPRTPPEAPASGDSSFLSPSISESYGSQIDVFSLAGNTSVGDSAVDLRDDDSRFSDLGKDSYASSFLSSILSEAEDYYWDNGRRYHAHGGGRYLLPNDETELDREDMKHHELMLLTSGRLHFSPIPSHPSKILDIGTGTGIWAMSMADSYPSAEVIGTDISPVQPKWVPPNLTFEVDDLELEWLYRPSSFDLINIRFMFLAIRDWAPLLDQSFRVMKEGGWIEITELAFTPTPMGRACGLAEGQRRPGVVYRWMELLRQGAEKRGYDYGVVRRVPELLRQAGFVDVREEVLDVPWGPWHQEGKMRAVGFWHMQQLMEGLQGITMHTLAKGLGWSPPDVELFLVDLRKELSDMSYKMLDHCHIIYAKKPER